MTKKIEQSGKERRQFLRIKKNFILSYYELERPEKKYDISQLKNISMGGLMFITTQSFAEGTKMGVDLNTPYLADATKLEGVVLGSIDRVKGILYETRIEFTALNPQAKTVISKMIEVFEHEAKNDK